jgi:hypothetical protein
MKDMKKKERKEDNSLSHWPIPIPIPLKYYLSQAG